LSTMLHRVLGRLKSHDNVIELYLSLVDHIVAVDDDGFIWVSLIGFTDDGGGKPVRLKLCLGDDPAAAMKFLKHIAIDLELVAGPIDEQSPLPIPEDIVAELRNMLRRSGGDRAEIRYELGDGESISIVLHRRRSPVG